MLRAAVLLSLALSLSAAPTGGDPRLKNSFRKPDQNGWTYVRLEGTPAEIGYQHGYWLAREIEDLQRVLAIELKHDTSKEYNFWRETAKNMLWPKIEQEYRDELEGIAQGLAAKGVKLDVWDVVVMNASIELSSYYNNWYDKQQGVKDAKKPANADRCSAFVATGSYTKDGKIVIAHNNWTNYMDGSRWTIMFDIAPAAGYHFLMDGLPGWIHSGDDFGVNSAGIAITETTISRFHGFDPNGVPEFVRARKAMQYSANIDDFVRIMKEGNNGGYANNWLVADKNTNEIADVELGLKNVNVRRTKDGYYVGTNFPVDPKLAAEETDFNLKDPAQSPNARRVRAESLIESNKGKIDVAFGKRYLSDHYDSYAKRTDPNERTLCGHIDLSPRGVEEWQPPYGTAGTVQSKVADASMVEAMSLEASAGHACGINFKASAHLAKHPDLAWEKEGLRDMPSRGWTKFKAK